MAPFLPVVAVSRSQKIRLGRGPGNSLVREIYNGDLQVNPQNGGLNILFYANLGDPLVRRDYQHHAAIGAIDSVGNLSTTVSSDLFGTGFAVTNGTGLSVNVASGVLHGRTFGGVIDVPAVTNLALQTAGTVGRIDTIAVDFTGRIFAATGAPAAAQVYEVDSVTVTGASAGTITLSGTYNGQAFTTAPIAYNAAASAVATAILTATGLSGTLTGSGGALNTAAVTLTASGALTGTFSALSVNTTALTGGTATYTQTTAGVQGPVAPVISGNSNALATVVVAAGATTPGTITGSTSTLPTS